MPREDGSQTFVSTSSRHKRKVHRGGGVIKRNNKRSGKSSHEPQGLNSAMSDVNRQADSARRLERNSEIHKAVSENTGLQTQHDRKEEMEVETEAPDTRGSKNDRVAPKDILLETRNAPTSKPNVIQQEASTTTESSVMPSDSLEPSRINLNSTSAAFTFTNPTESFLVPKEPSWFQSVGSGATEIDSCLEDSHPPTLSGLAPIPAHSPTPVVLTGSTDVCFELGPHQPHTGTPSESLGNTDTTLGRDRFHELPTASANSVTETSESPATLFTNEGFNATSDKNDQLFISFDTDLEQVQPVSAGTGLQQKPYLASVNNSMQKLASDADPTADRLRHVGRKDKPSRARQVSRARQEAKDAAAETEQREAEKRRSSVKTKKETPSGARRPRSAPYERQGQKWRCLECSALFSSRVGGISSVSSVGRAFSI